MNKDVKGLLKYLVIMSIIFLMPLGMVYCGLGALYYSGRTLAVIYFIYAIVLFLLYFILPVIFTYKAMKNHWSKYLDIFFYNKWLPTIILVILIGLYFVLPPLKYEWISFFVLPYYCTIYLTILAVNLINWYKNKYKKKYLNLL